MLYCNNKGFTLIELMVVLVIVGIMLALMVPSVGGFIANQEINEAAQNVAGALRNAKELAVSKNIRTQVWIIGDTTGGRSYTIYRQQMPGETLTSTDTVSVGTPAVTLYAVDTRPISLKGNIGMQTLAGIRPDGSGKSLQTSLQINFTPRGTADLPTGDTTIYLMSDKDLAQSKTTGMRAITVSTATGRVRIYQWGGTSWQ